jgi:hypothetical protein
MGVIATWQLHVLRHGHGAGVDDGELIATLNRDQHPIAFGVVSDIADLATQVDRATLLDSSGVNDGLGSRGFIGGPDRPVDWVVRHPVGILPGGATSDFAAGGFIKGDHVVRAGGGDKDPIENRYDEYPVHLLEVRDGTHYVPGVKVNLDDLACPEMSYEQQATWGVNAGVVESGVVSRQRYFADRPKRQR